MRLIVLSPILLLLGSLFISISFAKGSKHSEPPSVEFDCKARTFAYSFAIQKIPWSSPAERQSIQDALRLQECENETISTTILPKRKNRRLRKEASFKPTDNDKTIFVDPVRGDDGASGTTIHDPLKTLLRARDIARSLRLNEEHAKQNATIVLRGGRYYLNETLVLDARDTGLTIQAYPNEIPVISGGDLLSLSMQPTLEKPNIYSANLNTTTNLPHRRHKLNFTLLFLVNPHRSTENDDGSDLRLVWARAPNGHPEHDLQPDGYMLVNGTGSAKGWPNTSGAIHMVVKDPSRNSSVYPWFGQDLDPRGGGAWLHFGGAGDRFVDRKGFWNGTVPMGFQYLEQKPSSSSSFDTSNWTRYGYAPAIAHVFHNAFWGNWQFRIKSIDPLKRQVLFASGGWQEGRGGGMRNQPFFIEGVREALDTPGEWWLDIPEQVLYYYPYGNETSPLATHTDTVNVRSQKINFVAPRLKRLICIMGSSSNPAVGIILRGLTFTHTATTFMDPYEVPSPGDWSIRRDAAVFVENTEELKILHCRFLRTGGNAIFLSGHAKHTVIQENEFAWIGDSAVLTVGRLLMADGFTVDTYPENTYIARNHFHEIGIHGKQTSALFSALSCRTSFVSNVAYNGPRAGINLNDQFCHGHTIEDNLLFNWVRETQDHGPINTWDRAMYIQRDATTNQPTLIPQWTHISRNFLMNGPSGNRDLGNLFPTIDNDDGSSYFRIADNFMVYGGAKNYLGHDKIWISNLIVYPGRWSSGDPCAMIWAGKHHYFENNTCVVTPGNEPIGLDGSTVGFSCKIDWNDENNLEFIGRTAKNIYYVENAWTFYCGNRTSSSHSFTMKEMQQHGWETGSEARSINHITPDTLIAMAKQLLSNAENDLSGGCAYNETIKSD